MILPPEILYHIFEHFALNYEYDNVINCAHVCLEWWNVVESSRFILFQKDYYYTWLLLDNNNIKDIFVNEFNSIGLNIDVSDLLNINSHIPTIYNNLEFQYPMDAQKAFQRIINKIHPTGGNVIKISCKYIDCIFDMLDTSKIINDLTSYTEIIVDLYSDGDPLHIIDSTILCFLFRLINTFRNMYADRYIHFQNS